MRIETVVPLALGLALCGGCGARNREAASPSDTRQIKQGFDAAFEKVLRDYPAPRSTTAKDAPPSPGR